MVFGCRSVEDIVQNEEIFPLQTLAKDTATWFCGGILRDVDTFAGWITKLQELANKLEEAMRKHEPLSGRPHKDKVSLENRENNLEGEQLEA